MPIRLCGIAACAWLIVSSATAHADGILDNVRSTGTLSCGTNVAETDYSKSESHGDLSALARDVCRAVAAVILGNAGHMTLESFPDDTHGLAAVRSGKVALLVGGTPDLANDANFELAFGPPVFFDGQGFLVRTGSGVTSVKDLAGRQVCYISETTAEQDLIERLGQLHVPFIPFPFEETGEMEAALVSGHCTAVAAPVSALAGMRAGFHAYKALYEILPETITLEPFAPVYRRGDPQWATVVAWTIHALVLAEEAGVTQTNAAAMRTSPRPDVRRLLGSLPGIGKPLGLDDGWALRAIEAAGNYGEIFERDLGAGSTLKLPRGRNALWTQGGQIYAPLIH